jgi:hypothetical protein
LFLQTSLIVSSTHRLSSTNDCLLDRSLGCEGIELSTRLWRSDPTHCLSQTHSCATPLVDAFVEE